MVECDVAVIGASLAGSSLSLQLSKHDCHIVLIDSQAFPRPKICGEGLSSEGLAILRKIGVPIDTGAHQALKGYKLFWKNRVASIPLTSPNSTACGLGIDRSVLDSAVVDLVRAQKNVTTLAGSGVRTCEQQPDGCVLQLSDGSIVRARYVVAANGAKGRFQAHGQKRDQLKRYAFSQHMLTTPSSMLLEEVHIFLQPKYEIYVTPVAHNMINVAVMSSKQAFKLLRNVKGRKLITAFLESKLHTNLTPASPVLSTGPVGNMQHASSNGRVFHVGDACEQFDPIGGMGMTHALLSAQILSECLIDLLANKCTLAQTAAKYERRRNEATKPLRGFTRLTYFMLVALNGTRLSEIIGCSRSARWISAGLHQREKHLSARISRKLIALVGI